MTAPNPSLMEQATITRMGVFDEEIIRELEDHADDTPTCFGDCTNTAAYVIIARCCGDRRLICEPCLTRAEASFTDVAAGSDVVCGSCGHVYGVRPRFCDVLKVVAL